MQKLEIIAEAAQGFEGSEQLARLLVRAAKAGGADVVKFQLVYADELATRDYPYYALFKQLEMTDASWQAVARMAADAGLRLAFDVFGPRSLDVALGVGASGVKLHASDFFNTRLAIDAMSRAPHVYLSAGGIGYDDLVRTLDRYEVPPDRLTLMFGFQAEPTPLRDNHIARISAIAGRLPGVQIGFMDHADATLDESSWLGLLALPLGATAIEKHITLHRTLELEDAVSALDPTEFAIYAQRMRAAVVALGSSELILSPAEVAYGQRAVKTLVAARALEAGTVLVEADVIGLRAPLAEGLTPARALPEVVGRRLTTFVPEASPIYKENVR